jgi:hypothetical protein
VVVMMVVVVMMMVVMVRAMMVMMGRVMAGRRRGCESAQRGASDTYGHNGRQSHFPDHGLPSV